MTWFPFDPKDFIKDYATFGGLVSAFAVENELQARRENERHRLESQRFAADHPTHDDYEDDDHED